MNPFKLFKVKKPSPPKDELSFSAEQRIALWNALDRSLFIEWCPGILRGPNQQAPATIWIESAATTAWSALHQPANTRPDFKHVRANNGPYLIDILLRQFETSTPADVLELVAIFIRAVPDTNLKAHVVNSVNKSLEISGIDFRFVANDFIRTIRDVEMEAIRAAQSDKAVISTHLRDAEQHLADGQYRQAVKEAISAVEAKIRILTGTSKTLGEALKLLEFQHGAFHSALDKLYGFTSDSSGIRHSLLEGNAVVGEPEARFFLVSCSAFIGYLDTAKKKPTKKNA